jgi:hypothetical protein
MAKKRESRQKSRQSVAIRGENERAKGDRDTDRDTQPLPDSHNTCLRMHPNPRSQASDSRPREH